jgi:leucyl/phenylalanyl-tRNA--protein transferase
LRVARSLRRTLACGRFEIRLDTAFSRVIRACARVPRRGQRGTWITAEMIEAYERLHALGYAHSAEAWRDGELVGGLYGVSLGAVFFGESMFHLERDASKAAFAVLVRQLERWRFSLVDCQVPTRHLERLGAESWPRRRFLEALAASLRCPTRSGDWLLDPCPPDRELPSGRR